MSTRLAALLRRFSPSALCVCALTLFVLAAPRCASAATYYVSPSGSDSNPGTSGAPFLTIQHGINTSVSGDTVTVEDGTYKGPGDVDLDFAGRNITVTSVNGAAKTIIDCGGSASSDGSGDHRGFYLHSGETNAVISGLTIQNGYESGVHPYGSPDGTGGGINVRGAAVTVQNCVLQNDTAEFGGGGLLNDAYSTATLANDTFTGDTALGGYGGGLANDGTATLTNCALTGNSAQAGGGLYNSGYNSSNGSLMLTDCALTGNMAQQYGGGLYHSSYVPVALTNDTFSGNSAQFGGGLSNTGSGPLTLTNDTFTGNSAQNGGGFFNTGSAVTLTNDILYGDTAPNGSEVYNYDSSSTASATYCDIQGGFSGTGNLNADPLFVNAPADLHLQSGSPCLGAGTSNAPGYLPTDKDGRTRPNPPSVGAYELVTLPATALTVSNLSGAASQTLALSATLKKTGGTGLGGKTVTFSVDGTTVGTGDTNSSGVATKTYAVPATFTVGSTHTITAAFAGDTSGAASSGTGTLTVTKGKTTQSLPALIGVPGQKVTLSATLKGVNGKGISGETVSFSVDGASVEPRSPTLREWPACRIPSLPAPQWAATR